MPIPGVGFQEVVIILIAALMIFGPAKLPELMGQAGKALRDFRKMTGNLQGEFEKNLNEAAGTDVRKTLSSEIANLKGEVSSATASINAKPTTKTAARPVTTVAKPATTVAGKTATTTAAAAKKTGTVATGVGGGTTKLSTATAVVEPAPTDEIEFVPVRTTSRRGAAAASAGSVVAPPVAAAPASTTSPTRTRPESSNSSVAPVGDAADPFARARSRRQTAGYQR